MVQFYQPLSIKLPGTTVLLPSGRDDTVVPVAETADWWHSYTLRAWQVSHCTLPGWARLVPERCRIIAIWL